MNLEGSPPRQAVRAPRRERVGVRPGPDVDRLYEDDAYGRALLRSLMRAQLAVTLAVLTPAGLLIVSYPILASLFPAVASAHLGPLPLALAVLSGLIYPPIVLLGVWYVRRAERVDRRFADLVRRR